MIIRPMQSVTTEFVNTSIPAKPHETELITLSTQAAAYKLFYPFTSVAVGLYG